MSVIESKRKSPRLKVLDDCSNLINQVILVTSNEKKFPPKYNELTKRLIDTAFEIYLLCYDANNVYIDKKEPEAAIKERLALEGQAIRASKRLDGLLNFSYHQLHLRSNTVNFLWKLNGIARTTIVNWRASDKERLTK